MYQFKKPDNNWKCNLPKIDIPHILNLYYFLRGDCLSGNNKPVRLEYSNGRDFCDTNIFQIKGLIELNSGYMAQV